MMRWVSGSVFIALWIAAAAQGRASRAVDVNVPRVTTLVLQPSRLDTGKKYSLLPSPAELKEGDAAVFYNKAVEAMPRNLNVGQLQEWITLPLDKLPQERVAAVVQQAQASMQLIAQGTLCKDCNWPAFQPGTQPAGLSEYRDVARLLYVKARLEIAQKRYGDAVGTLRSGVAMARHIGGAPTLVQSLVGIAIESILLRGVEELAQAKDSPNLYVGLQALPRPLIDVEKPIAGELKALETSRQYTGAVRDAMRKQLEPAHERVRQIARRLEGTVAALQCIEALGHYAAAHGRQLPTRLGDIPDVQLPDDPATGKPFEYHLEGSKAILEVSPPQGGTPREGMRYEITIAP
jgi:hypothetical protein